MGEFWKAIRTLPAEDWRRAALIAAITTCAAMIFPAAAMAQALNVNLGTGAGLTERVVQMVGLLTVLSLAPSIVIMTTSFVRIVVVLSLLRTAIGLQQSPPNAVIISLSLFLTAIVMGPTFQTSYDDGIKPLLNQEMELPAAFDAAAGPVKTFMLKQVDQDDLALFEKLVGGTPKHSSPLEHQAAAYDWPQGYYIPATKGEPWKFNGNLGPGWVQHRKLIPGERATAETFDLDARMRLYEGVDYLLEDPTR